MATEPEENPNPHRDFGEILLKAACLETVDLESYLQQLQGQEPELASRLRHRLCAVEAPLGSFLNVPAADRLAPAPQAPAPQAPAPQAPAPQTPPPHTSLPTGNEAPTGAEAHTPAASLTPVSARYSLGECLGQGGMARVFHAFDERLSRPVALKFLIHQDPLMVRRLQQEARAQARVQHDHVLEVYDTGELEGQPFIAMRWVQGGTLQGIRSQVSIEQQARLLIQVAEGLHAAHGEGLIHRDIKPSNILVEPMENGDLRAFIADFGIATEHEAGKIPEEGLMGTPAYIAPELLSTPTAPVDRRSDVYSLGVTMYELFTGRRPHRGTDAIVLIQEILHRDPPSPRQLEPALPADLEAIILRCLERDPGARYPSARAVAEDLKRFLAGEVVEAYAAGIAYRLTRFVLRHRRLVTVAGIAVVALLMASVAIVFFAIRADRERARAEQERARAEVRREQAEELIDFMVVDLRKKLESVERLEILDEVNTAAMEYFAAVPAEELSDDELADRSRALYQIGEVRIERGHLAAAVKPLDESLALARHLSGRQPEHPERLFDLGQSYYWAGFIRWMQADAEGARPYWENYLKIARRLTEKVPDNLEWQLELSYAHSNLGSIFQRLEEPERALEHFNKTLAIDQQLVAQEPDNLNLLFELAGTHNTLGVVLRSLGRLDQTEVHYQADLDLKRRLVRANPAHLRWRRSLGSSLLYRSMLHVVRGHGEAAQESADEARQIFEDLAAHDPDNANWRYRLAWSHIRLGEAALALEKYGAAAAEFEQARRILAEGIERDTSDLNWRQAFGVSHYYLGAVRHRLNRSSARPHLRDAIETLEAVHEEQPSDHRTGRWLAKGLLFQGCVADTVEDSQRAWTRAEELLAPFSAGSRDGLVLTPWANANWLLGRHDTAQAAFEALRAQGYRAPDTAVVRDLCGGP